MLFNIWKERINESGKLWAQGSSKLELRNKIKQKKGKSYGYIYIETFNISD